MMRPLRAFIMPRNTAFESRNTEARLVCSTASQSSCFMRSSSMSRVMPALLHRMAIGALLRFDVGEQRVDRLLAGRHRAPRRARRGRPEASLMRGAAFGGGGGADDAGAVARQARRDGGADAARSARHQCHFSVQHEEFLVNRPSLGASASSKDCGSSSASIFRSRFLSIRRFKRRQNLAGPAFDDVGSRPRRSCVRTVAAQYTGVCSCLTSPARISSGAVCVLDVDAVDRDPAGGATTAPLASRTRSRSAAGSISELCAGTLTGSAHRAPRTLGRGGVDGARHRGRRSGDDHLARGVEIHRLDHLAVARPPRRRPPRRCPPVPESRPSLLRPAAPPLCMASRAKLHQIDRGLEIQATGRPPARVNSPRLCPAIDTGNGAAALAPQAIGRHARPSSMAGCVHSVAFSASAGTFLAALPQDRSPERLGGLGERRLDRPATRRRARSACRRTASLGREKRTQVT